MARGDYLKGAAPHGSAGAGASDAALSAAMIEHIIAAARTVHASYAANRSDRLFDRHIGVELAARFRNRATPPDAPQMMTAILLTHCGYDAALIFVLTLNDAGVFFDVAVGPDIAIRCTSNEKRHSATIDVYGVAETCRQSGALPQDAGPFRGPAQILWDAAYTGIARTDASIAKAERELVDRVRDTWDLEPPPEPPSLCHTFMSVN